MFRCSCPLALAVIAGLDPAIQGAFQRLDHWMPGSGPGMTAVGIIARWYERW